MHSLSLLALLAACTPHRGDLPRQSDEVSAAAGRELFNRTWFAQDARAAGGDGLGPYYNDSSCVSCHNQGGAGGAGPKHKNVTLRDGVMAARFSVDAALYPVKASGRQTQRNATALFGAGLIDQVSAAQVEALALAQTAQYPWVSGRVARDPEGRPGRFGWKAERPGLEEFIAVACENELGLQVPMSGAGADLDLGPRDFYSLVAYVESLPAPVELARGPQAEAGHQTFGALGCVACHVEQVGTLRGAYTDLLIHDMGKGLSDDGSSYGRRNEKLVAQTWEGRPDASEWRTPALWGLRDSSPYLHDGRADTIDAAVRLHDGEAAPARAAWVALDNRQRADVVAFLDTLAAPYEPAVVAAR